MTQFTAKIGNDAVKEVVYLNPQKTIPGREAICNQIADTMVRAIVIVVACLASIQIASPSREIASSITKLKKQTGGGRVDKVADVLMMFEYLDNNINNYNEYTPFKSNNFFLNETIELKFNNNEENNIVNGVFKNKNTFLVVKFLDPIVVRQQNVFLPIQIVDDANIPWVSGVLYKKYFKSFGNSERIEFGTILDKLFNMTHSLTTQEDIRNADNMFKTLQGNGKAILSQQYQDLLQKLIRGKDGDRAERYFYPVRPKPGMRQQEPGMRQQEQQYYGVDRRQYRNEIYNIPTSSKNLLKQLYSYRDLIAKQSSPAAIRAITLAGILNRDRTVNTNVCNDPLWKESTLHKIYPWATFQFLSNLKNTDATNGGPEIWKKFITNLSNIYNTSPKLNRGPTDSFTMLEELKFTRITELKFGNGGTCATPRVRLFDVQNGLTKIHEIYEEHVKKVWDILNSLIVIIQDPETNAEAVRIHPNVLTSSSGSADFIKEQSDKTCTILKDFYLAVEETYMNTIKSLQPV